MNNRVLITGATGFIGSHLARKLLLNDCKVGIIVREGSNLELLSEIRDQVSMYQYDGSAESLRNAVESTTPDLVIHLASRFISRHSAEQIPELVESNIVFGSQLVDAMVACGSSALINTGTSWQHFQNHEYAPVNLYAATKMAFESVLQYYVDAQKLRVVTLKLFDTYGPQDPRQKLFSVFGQAASAQQPVAMTAGEQLIDIVYIDDVTDAYFSAANYIAKMSVPGHHRFAVSSGAPLTLRKLAHTYEQALECQLNIDWGGRPYSPREVMSPWNTGTPVPDWSAQVDLHEGICRTFQADQVLSKAG